MTASMDDLRIRPARREDLAAVVALLQEDRPHPDPIDPMPAGYVAAFEEILADPDNTVVVAEHEGRVVGTFQLTFIRHLMRRGSLVAQIEAVHVDARHRSRGIGEAMMQWAIAEARRHGCLRMQLTSNKTRTRAHRFYERLGFERSHEGFKLYL
jgi:GNAT superfamily N-acetyltransferase